MAGLRDVGMEELVRRHRPEFFVETWLYKGLGLEYALSFPFARCYSIEPSQFYVEAFERLKRPRLAPSRRDAYTLLRGSSAEMLPGVLAAVHGPAFFHLDGSYPVSYAARDLQLLHEVLAVVAHPRDHAGDVVVVDGVPPRGRATGSPLGGSRPGPREYLSRAKELLGPTHDVRLLRGDAGYLVAAPRVDKPQQ